MLVDVGLVYEDYTVDKKEHYIWKISELHKILVAYLHAEASNNTYPAYVELKPEKKALLMLKAQKQKLEDYIIQLYGKDCLLAFRVVQANRLIS